MGGSGSCEGIFKHVSGMMLNLLNRRNALREGTAEGIRSAEVGRRHWLGRVLGGWAWIVGALALGGAPETARAQVTVEAYFEPAETALGESVTLNVKISGSQRTRQPPVIRMEGAQVQYLGPSLETSIVNAQMSITLRHLFSVVPTKLGQLELPPVEVEVDGQMLKTKPAVLRVVEPGKGTAAEPNQGAFVEMDVPSRPLYVGETFAVHIRLLVPRDVRFGIREMPDFQTDAFTRLPFSQPQVRQENRNGRDFDVVAFRSTLTAVKAGRVALGPVTMKFQMASPRKPDRGNSPFGSMFDGFPFGGPQVMQERVIRLEEHRMEVRELPTEGKPETFRGAIGQFRFGASTEQKRVKLGEPLTVNLSVEGQGNFDRIEVPPIEKAEGWRVYPPETGFAKADDSGMSGTKTFRIPAVPEVRHTETPRFVFSYFDPETGKYATLLSPAGSLRVEGGALPEPKEPVVEKKTVPPKAAESARTPPPGATILDANTPAVQVPRGWSPSTLFWQVQGGIAGLLTAWVWAVAAARRRARAGAAPGLLRKAAEYEALLRRSASRAEFDSNAIRALQLRVSARSNQPAEAVGAQEVVAAFGLKEQDAELVRALFERDAAARFSGGAGGGEWSEEERGRVLELLTRKTR
ncbi:MAG: hypothetical protein RLZZ244_1300 [Verrucomicrobiota bacterium]